MNDDVDMATLFPKKRTEQMEDRELADHLKVSESCIRLYDRLANYKFETAERYLEDSGLASYDCQLVTHLSEQYGNCGWICGNHAILINAALRSLPKYIDYLIAVKAWEE